MVIDKLVINAVKKIIISKIQKEQVEIKKIGDEFESLLSREKELWIFLIGLLRSSENKTPGKLI